MIRMFLAFIAAILALGLFLAPSQAQAKERAICPVCNVEEGKSEAEEVKAMRAYASVGYGFCSEKCAKKFDRDPVGYLPPTFPRPAPRLHLSDLSGQLLTWEGLKGKVVLIDFWATWCVPCRKSMPELQALHEKYAAQGFTVLGVSIDESQAVERVRRFISSKKITYPIALDSEKAPVWERFHVKAVPAAFLVDRDGHVVAQWTGARVDLPELEEKLGSLLAPVN
jgi:peroxiredoxin/YHS domain-containing protein